MAKAVHEETEGGTATVLLANGHRLLRQGLKQMLLADGSAKVVAEADNYDEAVILAQEVKPDVVVLDAEESVVGAWRTMERILAVSPPPGVVVIAVQGDNSYRPVWELLARGASAYLDKHASPEDLIAAVQMASRRPREGNALLAISRVALRVKQEEKDGISKRELQVLRLAARGLSNRQIAHHLRLSEATVKRHLANLYPKMNVGSRSEATRKALEQGWISLREVARDGQDPGRD
jgi:DNA-binding NarL/FixJ family response regulator